MSHTSSTAGPVLPHDHRRDDRPFVPDRGPWLDADEHGSRIRARRVFSATGADVLTAWTSAPAWERWMRLQSKSRASMASCRGGAFRLEVAEGPRIHVITGDVMDVTAERVSLSWCRHEGPERGSVITATIRETERGTELVFVHDRIASRREASWLMRFWRAALDRLDGHLARFAAAPTRPQAVPNPSTLDAACSSRHGASAFLRSA